MVRIPLAACIALVAFAFTAPDATAGARATGCHAAANCSLPAVAFEDAGCGRTARITCGGERSILRHRGEGRWWPGKLIVKGTAAIVRGTARVAVAPVRLFARATFQPQARRHGWRCH